MTEPTKYDLPDIVPRVPGLVPVRWRKIRARVRWAKLERSKDPSYPPVRFGRFEALDDVGNGGCGIVFKARDPKFDRIVALKLCFADGDKAGKLITDEARAMAKLSHPNIVTVYEPGETDDGAVFFVMEYVEGITGRDLVNALPPWQRAVDVYIGAGRGLAEAHRAGVIHGDFKPSNILIDRSDCARVSDFGLSRVQGQASEDGSEEPRRRPGTLEYQAPEVLRGGAGDERSDQWSYCIALWETINMIRTFADKTAEGVLESIENCSANMPDPSVPAALNKIVAKGLEVGPDDRYPDMDALVDELEELRKPPAPKPPRGSLWTPTIVALAIVLVAGLVALGWERLRDAPLEERQASRAGFEIPCALEPDEDPAEVRAEVVAVCHEIRQGEIDVARRHWVDEYDEWLGEIDSEIEAMQTSTDENSSELVETRRDELEEELVRNTRIVARTFIAQAEALREAASGADPVRAEQLEAQAGRAFQAGQWLNLCVDDGSPCQSKHSTVPSSFDMP